LLDPGADLPDPGADLTDPEATATRKTMKRLRILEIVFTLKKKTFLALKLVTTLLKNLEHGCKQTMRFSVTR
jgi:hypothetical protein